MIDTQEYWCMLDMLSPHDLFKFWEINDNMSETVQDNAIVPMKD